jgi:hypothetical protein
MRTYVSDLAGGTATATIAITESATLGAATFSFLSTAAGKIELSRSPSSQIGTAQPTRDVICRLNTSGTAGNVVVNVPLNEKVRAFDNIYVHQTGAGNLGSVTLS